MQCCGWTRVFTWQIGQYNSSMYLEMWTPEEAWKVSKEKGECKRPWFQNPKECKERNIYIFRDFDSEIESKLKLQYKGPKQIPVFDYHPGRPYNGIKVGETTAYEFYLLKPNGEQYPLTVNYYENNNKGCFREVETKTQSGGTRRRRMRKATRRSRSRRNRK